MGCHFLLQGSTQPRDQTPALQVYSLLLSHQGIPQHIVSRSVMSDSLQPHGLKPARLLCPWNFPGKNTGVGGASLLQGIFPTQGWNPGRLHCRRTLHHLSHQGSPFFLLHITKDHSAGLYLFSLFRCSCCECWSSPFRPCLCPPRAGRAVCAC